MIQFKKYIAKLVEQVILSESRFEKKDDEQYKGCQISDIYRMEIIDDFLRKAKENSNYNKEQPSYTKLVDDWDGYDDQVYIQNNTENGYITYWEGWVDACWSAVYSKREYKAMSKKDVIEDVIQKRFPRIAQEFGFSVKNSEFFLYKGKYIMKIDFDIEKKL